MNKIREIIEKYAPIDGYLAIHGFEEDQCKIIRYADFDKLEKDLDQLIKSAVEEEQLKIAWKALEFGGFTRGEEFEDEDIFKAIREE